MYIHTHILNKIFLLLISNLFTVGRLSLCHNKASLVEFKLGVHQNYSRETLEDIYDYLPNSQLSLSRLNVSSNSEDHCLFVNWTGESSIDNPLMDCFNITDGDSLYGGYESYDQFWPINHNNSNDVPFTPFVPSDFLSSESSKIFGSILHPVWFISNGVVIYARRDIPLHVNISHAKGQVCLQSLPYSLACTPHSANFSILQYSICAFQNISIATQFFLNESGNVDHPIHYPDVNIFKHPIWSTQSISSINLSSNEIRNFAANITKYKYNVSQLEISDSYSSAYGDLKFSTTIFPNYQEFYHEISSLPISLAAWVNLFINTNAATFQNALENNYLLPGRNGIKGNSVSLVKWWNGYGSVINLIDENTRNWFQKRLSVFRQTYNLTTILFEGGEETYLPRCAYMNNPTQYASIYNKFAGEQNYSPLSVMKTAYFGQEQPIFYKLPDKNSTWGFHNGLKSVLTSTISLGLAGYPFIRPGNIGGNPYSSLPVSKELYVRWLQLVTFLPVMEFSIPPWQFNSEIVSYSQNMSKLHVQIVEKFMLPILPQAVETGFPIIRPLWWLDSSEASYKIYDEFLIGENLLVAPVMEKGTQQRTVYFPPGFWKCLSTVCDSNNPYSNANGTHKFQVSLWDILYFERCTGRLRSDCPS